MQFFRVLTRLDGKQKKVSDSEVTPKPAAVYQRGIPDYDYEIGMLKFFRTSRTADGSKDKNAMEAPQFEPFSGAGQSLRQTKQRK